MRLSSSRRAGCWTLPRCFRRRSRYTFAVATVETTGGTTVTLTERAAEKVRALMAQEPAGEAEVLRVAIQGGGCGGFEYALGFDRGAADDDAEFEFHGVRVVVDPAQRPLPAGRDGRLRRVAQGVGVQDREPERLRLVRLRSQLPGRRRRRRRRSRLRLLH